MARTRGGREDHYIGVGGDQPGGGNGGRAAIMGEQLVTAGPAGLVVG